MIASIFSSRPMQKLSPKEISKELDLDIQLVTSIVSRLRAEGLIERVGWGQYKLRMEQVIDDSYIQKINSEMRDMASMILGRTSSLDRIEPNGNPYLEMMEIYRVLKELGGQAMASNLLRLCAKKSLNDLKRVDLLLKNMEDAME